MLFDGIYFNEILGNISGELGLSGQDVKIVFDYIKPEYKSMVKNSESINIENRVIELGMSRDDCYHFDKEDECITCIHQNENWGDNSHCEQCRKQNNDKHKNM